MFIENITSEKMDLSFNGKVMQIKVYEDLIQKKDKEIEQLNNEIKILLQENNNKEKVIIKQDNIINELEKWLKNIDNIYKDIRISYEEAIEDTLDKLKELKESGNNEN